jgi:hypothetical protein
MWNRGSILVRSGFLLVLAACAPQRGGVPAGGFSPEASAIVRPGGYPPFCKWMLAPDLEVAHWLGARIDGKHLVEPLNVVILDSRSRDPREAQDNLEAALASAGFPRRFGHSAGYFAYVDGRLYPQLPAGPHRAYADEPFELPNDHGRVFGPVPVGGRYLFVAGFSRETVAPLSLVKHRYVSFNHARDRLAERLDRNTAFKRRGYVDLQNRLTFEADHSTGDHDGRAVVLER